MSEEMRSRVARALGYPGSDLTASEITFTLNLIDAVLSQRVWNRSKVVERKVS